MNMVRGYLVKEIREKLISILKDSIVDYLELKFLKKLMLVELL